MLKIEMVNKKKNKLVHILLFVQLIFCVKIMIKVLNIFYEH